MQASMWSSYFVDDLPREMAQRFVDRGWQASELSDEHAHDLLELGDPTRVGAEFRRTAADLGLSFPQGHFLLATRGIRDSSGTGRRAADIAPVDDGDFEAVMDVMRRWVDLFAAVGIRAGVLHAGGNAALAAGWEAERVLARRVEAVRRVAEHARGGPTVVCLENLFRDGLRSCEDLEAIIDAVGMDNVAICLDTGHAHMCGIDVPSFIRRAGDRLLALHIADNQGVHDEHLLPYGRGTVPWTRVMQALREANYDGPFNFEVPGESHAPLAVRLAKLDYVKRLAEWMIDMDGV